MDAVTRMVLKSIGWREQPGLDADGRPYLAMVRGAEYFHVHEASALKFEVKPKPYADGERTSKQVVVSWRVELCDTDERRVARASGEELKSIAEAAKVCASSQIDVMRPALDAIATCAPMLLREGSIYARTVTRAEELSASQLAKASDA